MTKKELEIAQAACCVGTIWDQYEGTEKFNEMVGKRVQHLIALVRNHLQQGQPELPGIEDPGIPGKDFIPVEWVDACEMYGKWKIVKQERPEALSNLIDADAVRDDFVREIYRVLDADPTNDRANAIIDAFDSLPTIQQEQPELPGYDKALLEVKSKVDELYEEASIGLNEYDSGLYNGITETCMKLRGFIKARLDSGEQPEVDLDREIEKFVSVKGLKTRVYIVKAVAHHFYGFRNRTLEEAARHVYESWNGGTMDDARRDMAELGKVLNARK